MEEEGSVIDYLDKYPQDTGVVFVAQCELGLKGANKLCKQALDRGKRLIIDQPKDTYDGGKVVLG